MAKSLVLVVDDDEAHVELLRDALALGGYRVASAVAGEAIALAQLERPDVILVDLLMPRVGGREVCERLRSEPRTATIPIVAVSASIHLLVDASLKVDARLLKPFDLPDLYAAVGRWAKPG